MILNISYDKNFNVVAYDRDNTRDVIKKSPVEYEAEIKYDNGILKEIIISASSDEKKKITSAQVAKASSRVDVANIKEYLEKFATSSSLKDVTPELFVASWLAATC